MRYKYIVHFYILFGLWREPAVCTQDLPITKCLSSIYHTYPESKATVLNIGAGVTFPEHFIRTNASDVSKFVKTKILILEYTDSWNEKSRMYLRTLNFARLWNTMLNGSLSHRWFYFISLELHIVLRRVIWTNIHIPGLIRLNHYNDVVMGAMASQITSLTIVYSTVYSGADKRKHQSSASLAFVWGIHRWAVNSPQKGPVTRKMLPFDDVIILPSVSEYAMKGFGWNRAVARWEIHRSWIHIWKLTTIQPVLEWPVVQPNTALAGLAVGHILMKKFSSSNNIPIKWHRMCTVGQQSVRSMCGSWYTWNVYYQNIWHMSDFVFSHCAPC